LYARILHQTMYVVHANVQNTTIKSIAAVHVFRMLIKSHVIML